MKLQVFKRIEIRRDDYGMKSTLRELRDVLDIASALDAPDTAVLSGEDGAWLQIEWQEQT